MSAPKKLRGQSDGKPASELTRFKVMWRDSMSESAKDFWRSRWLSDSTQAAVRKEIFTKLKINLTYDDQLKAMRDWDFEQQKRDMEAEQMAEDERRLTEEHGDNWTLDQIREEVLKKSYARSLATGDFASGRKTIVQDLNVKKLGLEERRIVLLEKKAAAYDRAQAALIEAKNSKGGITPETLKKIESELRLL